MASITALTYTNNMAASKKPLLTDLEESLTSIQTWANLLKDDLIQTVHDAYGTGYALDHDAAKNFTTNNLYNKQSAVDTYTGGSLTISTASAWTDPDATNLALVFTPEYLAGDFLVHCQFSLECVSTNATNEIDIAFRLTDGSTNSNPVHVHMVTGVTATNFTVPVHLTHEFASLAASEQTIKLQYYITTQTATTVKILAVAATPFQIYAAKV